MKVLVANRGEIAVRVMRACRDLGLATVAVYSDCDRAALHVRYADEAYPIGPSEPAQSYLCIEKLIDVARRARADAVHPGYGFLAENPEFARACCDARLLFIGPSAEVIELMGGKTASRHAALEAGVAVVPGTDVPLAGESDKEAAAMAARVGYPLLVKADAGGGGKGMRLVSEPSDLPGALREARAEARSAFGNAQLYFERCLQRPRHVEVQVLGDQHGTVLPFVERECSVQRRHQKVVEESPSVAVRPAMREALAAAATAVARRVGYTSAGTVEFLLDQDDRFYYLEMNTRLQVEHPITEMVTGVDLVQWQIRIARGERLTLDPERMCTPRGHAIECRIYAEDPDLSFMASPGRILGLRAPSGPGIRDDSGVTVGFEVPVFYDSLISKLIAWGEDRPQATRRMVRALREYDIRGIKTTIPFFLWLLQTSDFLDGRYDTSFLDRVLAGRQGQPFVGLSRDLEDVAVIAAALHVYQRASAAPLDGRAPAEVPSAWRRAARVEGLRS